MPTLLELPDQTPPDEIDEEIIDIFAEEVGNILNEIVTSLNSWKTSSEDTESLQILQRHFHTLKGSGSLVGAEAIVKLGGQFENLLNQVIDEAIPANDAIWCLLDQLTNLLPSMVEQFKTHQPTPEEVTLLISQVQQLTDQLMESQSVDDPALSFTKPLPTLTLANPKLFKLQITGLRDAAQLSKTWATHVVSILNTHLAKEVMGVSLLLDELVVPSPAPGLCLHRCYFDDVIPEDDWGLVLATLEDIQAILSFTENLTADDKLLVHCSAGISRSTAVACGILCQHGLSPQEALKTVFLIRNHASPNAHIISLMDDALELRGLLTKTYTRFVFLS